MPQPDTGSCIAGGIVRKRPQEVLPGLTAPKKILVDPPTSFNRVTGMETGGPKIITSFSAPPPKGNDFNPLPQSLPPNLGKLARSIATREKTVGFLQACIETRPPPKNRHLPKSNHLADPLIKNTASQGVPIHTPRGMTRSEKKAAPCYGAHASAPKQAVFVHQELVEQLQAGHEVVFPLSAVDDFPNLWL